MALDKETINKLCEINVDTISFVGSELHDPVEKPNHYTSGSIECIDALREALSKDEFEGLCKGSALQYIWRESKKNGSEDIKKAIWYLNKLLSVR